MTAAYKLAGGRDCDLTDFHDLHREHRRYQQQQQQQPKDNDGSGAGGGGGNDDDNNDDDEEEVDRYLRGINSHLFAAEGKGRVGEPGRVIRYYDCIALYSTAGNY